MKYIRVFAPLLIRQDPVRACSEVGVAMMHLEALNLLPTFLRQSIPGRTGVGNKCVRTFGRHFEGVKAGVSRWSPFVVQISVPSGASFRVADRLAVDDFVGDDENLGFIRNSEFELGIAGRVAEQTCEFHLLAGRQALASQNNRSVMRKGARHTLQSVRIGCLDVNASDLHAKTAEKRTGTKLFRSRNR